MFHRFGWIVILAIIYALLIHYALSYSAEVPEPDLWAKWAKKHADITIGFTTAVQYLAIVVAAIIVSLILTSVIETKAVLTALVSGALAAYALFPDSIKRIGQTVYTEIEKRGILEQVPAEAREDLPVILAVFVLLPFATWLIGSIKRLASDFRPPSDYPTFPEAPNSPQDDAGLRRQPKKPTKSPFDKWPDPSAAAIARYKARKLGAEEQKLLNLCLGDWAKMERLIEHEQSHFRGISRLEAVRRAIASIHKDNR